MAHLLLFIRLMGGNPIDVKLEKLSANTIKGFWYNPRESESIAIELFKNIKKLKLLHLPRMGHVPTGYWFWMMLRRTILIRQRWF